MTDRAAVTAAEIADLIALAPAVEAGRIVPIRRAAPLDTLVDVLAARHSGAIPLVGDARWPAEYWDELRARINAAPRQPALGWATFSSGTTSTPRVILRSAASWSDSFEAVTDLLGLSPDDTVYLPAPLSASLSLFSVAHAHHVGASILLPGAAALGELATATVLHGTPYSLRSVVEAIEAGGRHRMRVALVGGARLEPELRTRAEAVGIRVVAYYGAAELSFVAVDPDGAGLRPFPGAELREVAGELWVTSPYLAAGYLGESVGSLRRDGEWATVGDLVASSPLGSLEFQGRRDGAILTAAATVIPEEVERALRTIEGVHDAVVFDVPNPGAGSLVGVVIETNSALALRDLRELARERLAPTHLPRQWFRTAELPRTATGKPTRGQIRDDALTGRTARYE